MLIDKLDYSKTGIIPNEKIQLIKISYAWRKNNITTLNDIAKKLWTPLNNK